MDELAAAVEGMSQNSTGGVVREYGNEYALRGMGRTSDLADMASTLVKNTGSQPVTVGDVAQVRIGSAVHMGMASRNGQPADPQPSLEDAIEGTVPEQKTAEEPQPVAADPQPATPAVEISPLVKELANIATIQAFGARLKELKAQGKVGVYGKYKELPDPDNCLLVVYNRQGTIEAVLTAGAQRYNATTALPDAIANYPGCAAIGFTLK